MQGEHDRSSVVKWITSIIQEERELSWKTQLNTNRRGAGGRKEVFGDEIRDLQSIRSVSGDNRRPLSVKYLLQLHGEQELTLVIDRSRFR